MTIDIHPDNMNILVIPFTTHCNLVTSQRPDISINTLLKKKKILIMCNLNACNRKNKMFFFIFLFFCTNTALIALSGESSCLVLIIRTPSADCKLMLYSRHVTVKLYTKLTYLNLLTACHV